MDTLGKHVARTRTAHTEAAYLKAAERLRERYLFHRAKSNGQLDIYLRVSTFDEFQPDPEVELAVFEATYTEIAKWMAELAQTLRPNSRRQYRANLNFLIEHELRKAEAAEYYALDALRQDAAAAREILANIEGPCRADVAPRGAAKKKKSLTLRELGQIQSYVYAQRRGEWAPRVARWLLASIHTGLRPCEWERIDVTEDEETGALILLVQNAKATNGRANGNTRTIVIQHDDKPGVTGHLYEMEQFRNKNPNATFKQYYDGCRSELSRIGRRLWPKKQRTISLYTGRHQFSANKKADGATRRELADLMGHASDETAGAHYGKRRSGWNYKQTNAPKPKRISGPSFP